MSRFHPAYDLDGSLDCADAAIRQRTRLSPYIERERDFANGVRQPVRDRVGAFLIGHHTAKRMRLLSFPSMHWTFEHQIAAAVPTAEFIGVERLSAVVHRSVPWMPGLRPRWFGYVVKDRTIHGVRTECAKMLNTDITSLVRLRRTELGGRSRRRMFFYEFKGWSAIWLDFTAQLCSPVEAAIQRIGTSCHKHAPAVPIAVTVMKGRETDDITAKLSVFEGSRSRFMAATLNANRFRSFELVEVFEHISSKATMLTIMGLLRLRPVPLGDDYE